MDISKCRDCSSIMSGKSKNGRRIHTCMANKDVNIKTIESCTKYKPEEHNQYTCALLCFEKDKETKCATCPNWINLTGV